MSEEEEELAKALALSLGAGNPAGTPGDTSEAPTAEAPAASLLPLVPSAPLELPADIILTPSSLPLQSMEDRLVEICGCSKAVAASAVQAAGPGGLPLAIDIVLSGGALAPVPKKLVCLVRQDLNMGAGKVAAQVAHGALGAYRKASQRDPQTLRGWEDGGEACIILGVPTLEALDRHVAAAARLGLITHTIQDAGRTEVATGTRTVGCIGPGSVSEIDAITGGLSLY